LKTIQNGKTILEEMIEKEKKNQNKFLSWKDVFKLYDTYGFPLELTKEIATENWLEINEKEYEDAVNTAKENSRQATKEMFKKWIDWSKYLEWIPQTKFIWYKEFSTSDVKLLKDFEVNGQRVLIFDKTPFYPEMWGQMWDKGTIELDDWSKVKVINVQTFAGVILHIVE
jgi:alanyl-tRNA synthetase